MGALDGHLVSARPCSLVSAGCDQLEDVSDKDGLAAVGDVVVVHFDDNTDRTYVRKCLEVSILADLKGLGAKTGTNFSVIPPGPRVIGELFRCRDVFRGNAERGDGDAHTGALVGEPPEVLAVGAPVVRIGIGACGGRCRGELEVGLYYRESKKRRAVRIDPLCRRKGRRGVRP